MILQPKRWESSEHPRYDPIRHKPWFWRLEKRKKVLPRMEGCYNQWTSQNAWNQEELCDIWNVNPREFRDYCSFIKSQESRCYLRPTVVHQSILDNAYILYCASLAEKPIQNYIETFAPHYGIKGRPVWEEWETNWGFYPKGYLNNYPI